MLDYDMQDSDITNTLKDFGLSENETTVYLATLQSLEELSPYQISKLTGIPRTTVYDVLMTLSLKGLVELEQSDGYTKQQTRVTAKNPSTLRDIIRQRRKELVNLDVGLVNVLPKLMTDYHNQRTGANVEFYPGVEGAKQLYSRLAEYSKETTLYVWSKMMPMDALSSEGVNRDIDQAKQLLQHTNAHSREIIPLNDWTKHVLSYQLGRDKDYLIGRDFRVVDSPMFEMYLDLIVVEDYVKAVCAEQDEVWGLIIHSSALAKTLISIHQLQWMQATPVSRELIESWGENEFLKRQQSKEKTSKTKDQRQMTGDDPVKELLSSRNRIFSSAEEVVDMVNKMQDED